MTEWPADKVERRAVSTLVPYARNSRTHSPAQIDQIAASVREWGWTTPVLIAEDGGIIAGHGRILAAQKLGIADVPVMVARGWTEAQKRAYVIADNQVALNAGWSEDLLAVEIADLHAAGFDLSLTGFDPGKLAEFLTGMSDDDAPEPQDKTAPDDFAEYDETVETEHCCPKCGYRFSGGKVDKKDNEDA